MKSEFDAIVIGAGAAGLMCAGFAAARGRRVLVLDHADAAGKKILISGGGRCNFTNHYASAEHYISNNPHFCKGPLARFSATDFLAIVESRGIAWHERDHGQLFCDHSARDILDLLLAPCREHGVKMQLSTKVQNIEAGDGFRLTTDRGEFRSQSLVIATGGLSIPKLGASAFGLDVARRFGLRIIPPRAGLVPLRFTGAEKEILQTLAGISLPVTIRCHGQSFRESMLFTHRGISGPAVLQISSYWQPGDALHIGLIEDAGSWLKNMLQRHPGMRLDNALAQTLPRRLAGVLMQLNGLPIKRLAQLNTPERQAVIRALSDWRLKPAASEGYRTAEVTVGGVDTDELSSKTMQTKKIPGLYFIGEVVDVTGHLGGFNFQWAWSSGYVAGQAL